MKKINVILACLCSLFLFTGCYTNVLGDGIEPNPNPTPNTEIEEISIKCKLDVTEDYNTDGLIALTMAEQKESIDADFEISAIKNGIPQLLFIEDDDENVLMMSRGIYEKGQTVEINAETTTLALVTLHPMLGPITENYNELVQIIQTSEYYQPLYDEVKNCIENKKNIFDARNDQLMVALSNLLNNLCEDPSEYIQTTRASIATRSRLAVNSYPIHVSASGRTLTMKTIDLAPSYYGTVTTPSGTVKDLAVKSAGNYAGFNYILNNSSNLYGTPETFYFNTEGNYRFDLSRSNNQGLVDFYTNMVNGILQILGLRSDDLTKDLINALINQVRSAMEEDENANWIAMCKSVIEICGNVLYQEIIKDSGSSKIFAAITGIAKGVTWAIRLYDGFTGNANAMGMLAWWFNSPKNINFCLCYNNGKIESCTESELSKVSGDNQIGEANQRLLLPLKVKVVTKNDNGLILPNIYQNIKFKVDNNKGAVSAELVGTDDEASVYWTLGDGNPGDVQKVTAIVVDQTTGEDISDPVEFTASIKDEEKKEDDDIRKYLEKLYHDTDGDNWKNKKNWLSNKPVEEWYGVYKDYYGLYTIKLNDNNLKGTINISGCNVIEELSCYRNQLQKIDVSMCKKMKELHCDANQLINLNVSECSALYQIWCSNNQLADLDVSGLTALKELSCEENKLTKIKTSDCICLYQFLCSDNQLTSIDVSGLPALYTFACENNKLTSINVSGLQRLNSFICSNNKLTSINVSGLQRLYTFICSNNKLTSINVSGCINLNSINCDNNNLTSLDISDSKKVELISCTNNHITSEIPQTFKKISFFYHDRLYSYYYDYDLNKYVYKRNEYGWYYPGEPESGKHDWPSSDAPHRQIKKK